MPAIEVNPTDRSSSTKPSCPVSRGSWNGIFRTIPVQYRTPQGLNYTLRLDVESVTDADGRDAQIREQPRAPLPQAEDLGAGRGGRDPDGQAPLPRGERAAVLRRARRAVLERHRRRVGGADRSGVRAWCGCPRACRASARRRFAARTDPPSSPTVPIEPDGVTCQTPSGLGMREGLTLVVGWNPGVVHRPTAVEKARTRRLQQPAARDSAARVPRHVAAVAARAAAIRSWRRLRRSTSRPRR